MIIEYTPPVKGCYGARFEVPISVINEFDRLRYFMEAVSAWGNHDKQTETHFSYEVPFGAEEEVKVLLRKIFHASIKDISTGLLWGGW